MVASLCPRLSWRGYPPVSQLSGRAAVKCFACNREVAGWRGEESQEATPQVAVKFRPLGKGLVWAFSLYVATRSVGCGETADVATSLCATLPLKRKGATAPSDSVDLARSAVRERAQVGETRLYVPL